MTREEIFEKVKDIISDKLGIDREEIAEDSSLIDDLGADSLDLVDLVMVFEEEFDVKIEDEELENIKTVKDVVDGIMSKIEGA
jgi:acyl carrier protein